MNRSITYALAGVLLFGCSENGNGSSANPNLDDGDSSGSADATHNGGDSSQPDANSFATTTSSCDGAKFLATATDPAARGPWPVGARTVTIAGLTVEVWYPALPGSETGKPAKRYDLRDWLPPSEKKKIPDTAAVGQTCDCIDGLPIDSARGPYPVIIFVHGTAGFRTQSLQFMQHWASRGFIVLAADHPRIMLPDALQLRLGADQAGDARTLIAAITNSDPALSFLDDRAAKDQLAVSGHSAGGMAVAALGDEPGVRVAIPMAAAGVDPARPVTSTLVLGGEDDATVKFDQQKKGYESTKGNKRLIGLANAGHLAFSDLCALGEDEGGIFEIAKKFKISFPPGTETLFENLAQDGCKEGQLSPAKGWAAVKRVTSAVLEDTLMCRSTGNDPLADIKSIDKSVTTYLVSIKSNAP